MSYVLVEDVPATWDRYAVIAQSMAAPVAGLLLHLAGPTDEGFRIVEVWENETAWLRHAVVRELALDAVDPDVGPRPTVRDLRAVHVVVGEVWAELTRRDRTALGPGETDSQTVWASMVGRPVMEPEVGEE